MSSRQSNPYAFAQQHRRSVSLPRGGHSANRHCAMSIPVKRNEREFPAAREAGNCEKTPKHDRYSRLHIPRIVLSGCLFWSCSCSPLRPVPSTLDDMTSPNLKTVRKPRSNDTSGEFKSSVNDSKGGGMSMEQADRAQLKVIGDP